jgi:hypothetical protein
MVVAATVAAATAAVATAVVVAATAPAAPAAPLPPGIKAPQQCIAAARRRRHGAWHARRLAFAGTSGPAPQCLHESFPTLYLCTLWCAPLASLHPPCQGGRLGLVQRAETRWAAGAPALRRR